MTEVAVIVPVLGRPASAQRVVDSFQAVTDPELARLVFVGSHTDEAQLDACAATGATVLVTVEAGYAAKVNLALAWTDEPWLFTGADDLDFHPGWLEAALAHADAGVVGTDDLCNPLVRRGQHSTHSLVSRAYVHEVGATFHDGPGVVLHPGYSHQWCDSELVEAAKARGVWAFAEEAVVAHLHPLCGRSSSDDTYRIGSAQGRRDRRLFFERQRLFAGESVARRGRRVRAVAV